MPPAKRTRPRDLPHPAPAPSKPERSDFNGSASRKKRGGNGKRGDDFVGSRDRKRRKAHPGDLRRVDGPNGSWPAQRDERPVVPRPPALCLIYDDLAAGEEPVAVFGQYPKGLIGKLLPYLDCRRHEILHLCSGSLKRGEGIRVDIRPDAHPTSSLTPALCRATGSRTARRPPSCSIRPTPPTTPSAFMG